MRIAIVDDERPARSELRHQIQELLKEAEIVEGDSGAAALQLAGDGKYELFFLDINLGDISGTVLVNSQYAATGKNHICDSLFRICS